MMRKIFGLVGMMAGLSGLAHAQAASSHEGHDMAGMDMPAVVSSTVKAAVATATPETDSTKAFKAADAKMHKDMMAAAYTGDADVDFLRNMIPHHQGAIDMANIVIKYGSDADVRMLAGDIVKAQETEIRVMKDWLMKHGPKDASASDARASLPVTVPVAAATTTSVSVPVTIPQPVVKKDIVVPTPPAMATSVMPLVVQQVAMISTTISQTIVTSSVPPVDKISATTAMTIGDATGPVTTSSLANGMPDPLMETAMPDMPAADAEIQNTAPKMEFLDGPTLKMPSSATSEK